MRTPRPRGSRSPGRRGRRARAGHLRYVSDPHEVVRSGQVVKVKVLEVDVDRQRIGLTLRLNDTPQQRGGPAKSQGPKGRVERPKPNHGKDTGRRASSPASGSMAQALRDAGFGR